MTIIIYDIIFLLVTIYFSFTAIGYAIYEIRNLNNKAGGIVIILLSIFATIFANTMLLLNQKILRKYQRNRGISYFRIFKGVTWSRRMDFQI